MFGLDWIQIAGLFLVLSMTFTAGRMSVKKKTPDVHDAMDTIAKSGCRVSRWLTHKEDKVLFVVDKKRTK